MAIFNPGAADLDIQEMVVGLETVATTKDGGFAWNDTVVKDHTEKVNDDGTKTFTITINDDLKFSDYFRQGHREELPGAYAGVLHPRATAQGCRQGSPFCDDRRRLYRFPAAYDATPPALLN